MGGVAADEPKVMLGGLQELKEECVPKFRRIVFKDNDAFDLVLISSCSKSGIKMSC